jgi:hypothetical protein
VQTENGVLADTSEHIAEGASAGGRRHQSKLALDSQELLWKLAALPATPFTTTWAPSVYSTGQVRKLGVDRYSVTPHRPSLRHSPGAPGAACIAGSATSSVRQCGCSNAASARSWRQSGGKQSLLATKSTRSPVSGVLATMTPLAERALPQATTGEPR